MANLTLAEARLKVQQYLDDAVIRWTAAQQTDALTDALSTCLTRYAREGGDRFDLETTATTSAVTGQVSISSVSPLWIKQVAVVAGNVTYRVPAKDPLRRGYADLNARSLRVLYVREYALPTTESHPLVGVGATEANSWRAFDKWVCLEAAYQMAAKDMEEKRLGRLDDMRANAAMEALARAATPGSYETPRPEWAPIFTDITWQFVQASTLALTRVWA